MAETIEVEHIVTQAQILKAFENLNKRMDDSEKKAAKLNKTSEQGAKAAIGSYSKLEKELRDNEAALKRMTQGTAEFTAQKNKVDALKNSVASAKSALSTNVAKQSGASQLVSNFVGQIAAVGTTVLGVSSIVSGLKSELAHFRQLNENERLASVGFEQAVNEQLPNVITLGSEKEFADASLKLSEDAGIQPGAAASLIGAAGSAGAPSLDEASKLIKDVNEQTRGNLALTSALASGVLQLTKAGAVTSNKEGLGLISQVQANALVKDPEELARNFAPALQAAESPLQRLNAPGSEFVSEILSIFTKFGGDNSGAESATIEKNFLLALDRFVPKADIDKKTGEVKPQVLKTGEKITLDPKIVEQFRAIKDPREATEFISSNENLRKSFEDTLGRRGLFEITRLVRREGADAGVIKSAEAGITDRAGRIKTAEALSTAAERATPISTIDQQAEARAAVSDIRGGRDLAGQASKIFEKAITGVNLPGIDGLAQFGARTAVDMEGANQVESYQQSLMEVLQNLQPVYVGDDTPANRSDIQKIEGALKSLADLRQLEQRREVRERVEVVPANQQQAAPVQAIEPMQQNHKSPTIEAVEPRAQNNGPAAPRDPLSTGEATVFSNPMAAVITELRGLREDVRKMADPQQQVAPNITVNVPAAASGVARPAVRPVPVPL